MPDSTHTYQGYVTLDPFAPGGITFTGGAAGTPGSVLHWNGLFSYADENVDDIVTDLNDDGILVAGSLGVASPDAGVDTMTIGGDQFGYSGYTITVGGVDYPLFEYFGEYFVPLPVNGSVNGIIPTSGSTNPYEATSSGTFLCFGEGTEIMTPEGETTVEKLKIGDDIRVADGRITQVEWVGRQTVFPRMAADKMQPVRIGSGALGKGLPYSELVVTADHGMVIDGLVINASALINGSTIDWVPMDELPEAVTYYHVETKAHDVILANGAPSETFVNVVTRSHFDNYQEYLELYGTERIIPEMTRPRINTQRLLPDAIKARLGIDDEVAEFDQLLAL